MKVLIAKIYLALIVSGALTALFIYLDHEIKIVVGLCLGVGIIAGFTIWAIAVLMKEYDIYLD